MACGFHVNMPPKIHPGFLQNSGQSALLFYCIVSEPHQYHRDIGRAIGPDDSLARLSSWIPWGSRVLELGPANGYFTRHMATQLNCTVDGVELDPHMAQSSSLFCRKMVVGDLALLDLSAHFAPASYQVIVLADVIEHLAAPEKLMAQLLPLLAPGGEMLLSVPNAAYAGLIAELLAGQFDYRDEGLLDRTHLRFFTRDSLGKFLTAAGLSAYEWVPVFRPLNESEFKIRIESLPAATRETLLASPQALCYQWLVKAGAESRQPGPMPPGLCQQDAFPLRVFLEPMTEAADPLMAGVVWGIIGEQRQTLRLNLTTPWRSKIRITLADRPGYLRLYQLNLFANDKLIWSWNSHEAVEKLTPHFHGLGFSQAPDHLLVTLLRSDSWLYLTPVDLGDVSNFRMDIELGWPMSSDFLVAKAGWEQALAPV